MVMTKRGSVWVNEVEWPACRQSYGLCDGMGFAQLRGLTDVRAGVLQGSDGMRCKLQGCLMQTREGVHDVGARRKGEWGVQFGNDGVQNIRHSVRECVDRFGGFSSVKEQPL